MSDTAPLFERALRLEVESTSVPTRKEAHKRARKALHVLEDSASYGIAWDQLKNGQSDYNTVNKLSNVYSSYKRLQQKRTSKPSQVNNRTASLQNKYQRNSSRLKIIKAPAWDKLTKDTMEDLTSNASSQASSQPSTPRTFELNINDNFLMPAIGVVMSEGQASVSLLQRRLRIGYSHAARLLEEMEKQGIVAGYNGDTPRAVLIDNATWERLSHTYPRTSDAVRIEIQKATRIARDDSKRPDDRLTAYVRIIALLRELRDSHSNADDKNLADRLEKQILSEYKHLEELFYANTRSCGDGSSSDSQSH